MAKNENLLYPLQVTRIIERIESVLSLILFSVMFFSIIIHVFFRYALKNPLTWTYELSIYAYIFIVFLGAGMASRRRSHIVFDLIYERFPAKTKIMISVVANFLTIITFVVMAKESLAYIKFMGDVKSSTLGIPQYVLILSFFSGSVLIIVHTFSWTLKYLTKYRSLG